MSQQPAGSERDLWLEGLFRPLVIAVMFGCIALSLVELVRLFFPTWNGTYLVLGCVLAALEANYSYRLTRARWLRGSQLLRFRAIEIALFFPLLKIGGYMGDPWSAVLADVQSWPRHLGHIFDPETMAAFMLAVLSWHVSTQTVREFERLHDPPEYNRYYVSPMERLTGRFFSGGIVLLIAAGLTRIGVSQLLNLRHPSVPGLVLNVLIYFLLGLVMLGQLRFATLRKRWQTQEIKVAGDLAGRWARYSLAFIAGVALLAFLLPTGYTLDLLELLGWLLGMTFAIISFAVMVLFWLITFPLAWLLSLLGTESFQVPPLQPPPRALHEPATGLAPNWFQVLQSFVFWLIALGMLLYLVRGYLRDRPELLQMLAGLGPIHALRRLWVVLRRWLGGWGKTFREHMPRDWPSWLARRSATPGEPPGLFRLRALSLRAQVLYYYLSTLRRAGQLGIPRRHAQTPYEYGATLAPKLPQAQQDVELLTQAFVEARYSQHVVQPDQARRTRASWQQVKAALRVIRRKADKDKPAL